LSRAYTFIFQFVLEHGYADIFYRDNLDIRQREAAVVAALVAVENADPQLSFHMMAGMGTGSGSFARSFAAA